LAAVKTKTLVYELPLPKNDRGFVTKSICLSAGSLKS